MRVFHVYSKTDCVFCKRAVTLLQREKEHFTLVVLDHAPRVLTDLSQEFGWNTVPIITLVEKYEENPTGVKLVGGCEDLERFLKDEKNAQKEKAKEAIEKYEENKEYRDHGNGD